MSRINSPGMISTRPTNNVYTGLAFISMVVTLAALVYLLWRMMGLGIRLF